MLGASDRKTARRAKANRPRLAARTWVCFHILQKMPWRLQRYQQAGDLHFVTFSCYGRAPYLRLQAARSLFENSLEKMRLQYGFFIVGYVVMPEHVHLLLSEPLEKPLALALKAIKVSVAKQSRERPFCQPRYYDFNVYTERKYVEKLKYMHRNPVKRGLVQRPEDWRWSSFRHYLTGEDGPVEVESQWTASRRVKQTDPG